MKSPANATGASRFGSRQPNRSLSACRAQGGEIVPTWRELQTRFEELMREERALQTGANFKALGAMIVRSNPDDPWRYELRDGPPKDPHFRQRFEQVATDAARLIGTLPPHVTPVAFWLDRLFQQCLENWPSYISQRYGDSDGGSLQVLCKASAAYCVWWDLQAIEANTQLSTAPGSSVEVAQPVTEGTARARKRGPKPGDELAERIEETVKAVAPDGEWRAKLDDICEALDERQIPCPKRWRKDGSRSWSDKLENGLRVKAIDYRLKQAKKNRAKASTETLS